ncbi:hypothetical protein BpHYR1_041499 [Brachionus plicatilis]|uniref:Uncharacterized protein n=1 Tax=Brachionus plicatilis TaxID=10195 RepID=A0A3M7SQN3_BRAPC|nr:hypothetical protein BpHYR1_041499 [Brachionus plicatilis]
MIATQQSAAKVTYGTFIINSATHPSTQWLRTRQLFRLAWNHKPNIPENLDTALLKKDKISIKKGNDRKCLVLCNLKSFAFLNCSERKNQNAS